MDERSASGKSIAADPPAIRIDVAVRTDVGCVRERNEDSVHVDPEAQVFIVADGMGGHGCGDVASAMAVASIRDDLVTARPRLEALAAARADEARRDVMQLLELVVRDANQAVVERSRREPEMHDMGSTVEVVVVLGHEAFIAHVGDSRTYLIRDGRATQLTTDHTVAEMMKNAGALSGDEARVSPMRSVLANAVGVTDEITVESVRIDLRPNDRLLICSDGLYDYFEPEELADLLGDDPPDRVLDAMVELARTRGGHDNISGVVVAADEATRVAPRSFARLGSAPAATPAATIDEALVAAVEAAPELTIDEPTRPVRAAEVASAAAAVVTEVTDETTRPRVAGAQGTRAPTAAPDQPLSDMSSEAVCAFVDRTIHEESRPNTRPGWSGPTRSPG